MGDVFEGYSLGDRGPPKTQIAVWRKGQACASARLFRTLWGSAHRAQSQGRGSGLAGGAETRGGDTGQTAPPQAGPQGTVPSRPTPAPCSTPPPTARLSSWGGGPGRDKGPNPGAGTRVAARPSSRVPAILSRRLHPQPRGCPPQPSGAPGSSRPALPATGFCRNRGLEWPLQGPRQSGKERAVAETLHPSAESGFCARPPP